MSRNGGLDLSKFKKSGENEHSVTLSHPGGHFIKIAKKGLSPELSKQLAALHGVKRFAEGGAASDYESGTKTGMEADEPAPAPAEAPAPLPPLPDTENMSPAELQEAIRQRALAQSKGSGVGSTTAQAAPAQDLDSSSPAEAPVVGTEKQLINPYAGYVDNSEAPTAGGSVARTPAAPPAAAPAATAPAAAAVPPPPVFTPQETASYLKTQDAAFQKDLDSGHIKPETFDSLFAKKDTLGKIGTVFGMMLSGAGSGLAHQPNVLLTMMQNEINNDLEAQKQSKTNAFNLLQLNQQHQLQEAQINEMNYKNALSQAQTGYYAAMPEHLKAENQLAAAQAGLAGASARVAGVQAEALAHMQANRIALHSLVKNLSQMTPGSPEYQRAQQTLGMIAQGVQTENFDIADRAAAMSALGGAVLGGGNDGSTEQQFQANQQFLRLSGHPEIAKDVEEKHIPGIPGKASIPLTADDRTKIRAAQDFMRTAQVYRDFADKNSGTTLNRAVVNEGKALGAALQSSYRKAIDGGVFKQGEQDFIETVVPDDPTQFFAGVRTLPKIDAAISDARGRLNGHLKSLGLGGLPQPQEIQYKDGKPWRATYVAGKKIWEPVKQ